MSTSITKDRFEIVIYKQKELLTELDWLAVEIWQNFEMLGSSNPRQAKRLWAYDNFDWDKYELTEDTLENLLSKASEFIKGKQK